MNGLVARENFKIANRLFNNAFNPGGKLGAGWDAAVAFRLCQSTLILEQSILQNGAPTALYTFPVLNNIQSQGGTMFNTEVRLSMQDSFVPTEVGISFAIRQAPSMLLLSR